MGKSLKPPDWVWELAHGTYVPDKEWNVLLKGYQTWHEKGARFPSGKGQSPDYKNYGVTLPSVAMALRRYDEANSGGVVPRTPDSYWTAIIMASVAVVSRMRAERYVAEAEAAIEFDMATKTIIRRAKRYVAISKATRCPRFYVDKLPEIPSLDKIIETEGETE